MSINREFRERKNNLFIKIKYNELINQSIVRIYEIRNNKFIKRLTIKQ